MFSPHRRTVAVLAASALALAGAASGASAATKKTTKKVTTTKAPAVTAAPTSAAPTTAAAAPAAPKAPAAGTLEADYASTEEQPPTKGPAPQPGKSIYVVICSAAAEGCAAVGKGFEEAGAALGWKVTIVDGRFGVGDGYNEGIRQGIAGKADAIALMGVDCVDSKAGILAAKDSGIPVIGVSMVDCPDKPTLTASVLMNNAIPDYRTWWIERGAAQARWIVSATNGQAKILTSNAKAASPISLVNRGFTDEIKKCKGCGVLETVDFALPDLFSGAFAGKMAASIASHPDATVILNPLDTMLLAGNVPAAVAATGRKPIVVGSEGLTPVMDLLRGGRVTAVVAFSSTWLGWGGAETINRILNKEKPVPQGIGWQTIDKEHNLDRQKAGSYQATIDFRAAYKKLWGK